MGLHSSITAATLGWAARVISTGDWSRLEDAIHAAESGGILVRTIGYRGDATTVIPSYMQLTKARLLIIDKHYGTARWRRNTTIVGTLSRAAPAPAVLPPQLRTGKGKPLSFGHIISAVDFTVASAVAVQTVLSLIRLNRCPADARPCLGRRSASHGVLRRRSPSSHEAVARAEAQVAQRLRKKIPGNVSVRVDARVTIGHPHRAILDVASEVSADLIVMGVPPRSRLDEVLFGSTLRKVLRRSTIPVLVLPVLGGGVQMAG